MWVDDVKEKEIIENYNYHPFQPIYIKNVEKQETTIAFESIIPAFLLYTNENKAFWHNFVKTGEYIIDGITIASGFASLRAAKYFAHVASLAEAAEGVTAASKVAKAANILRYVKGAAGVVEVTSSSVNLMLKLTELDETEFGQSLSKVLFYLELITLAGELTVPMKANLKKSAREVIDNADGVTRAKYTELFGELYKIVGVDSKILLKNKEFLKHLDDLKYRRITRVYPKLLSLEEEAVLRYYTTNAGYKNFNKALRGEIKMTDEFLAQEQLMNQALDKLPNYKTDALLYRIEYLTDAQIKEYYKVGEEVTNKHFTSTCYDQFAIGEAMKKRAYTVLIRIESKNGKMIEDISTLKEENEILFKSNTEFYVKDIKMTSNPSDWASEIKTIILIEK